MTDETPLIILDVPKKVTSARRLSVETECTLTREQYRAFVAKKAA